MAGSLWLKCRVVILNVFAIKQLFLFTLEIFSTPELMAYVRNNTSPRCLVVRFAELFPNNTITKLTKSALAFLFMTSSRSDTDNSLALFLRHWVRLQFQIMESMATLLLLFIGVAIQYDLAEWWLKPHKSIDTSLCPSTTGTTKDLDTDCLYCWDEIKSEHSSVMHGHCKTVYHEGCLQKWVRTGAEVSPTCPKCRMPLSKNANIRVVNHLGDASYGLLDLKLLFKRCTLISTCSILSCSLAMSCIDYSYPIHEQPALRITGVLVSHTAVWLTTTTAIFWQWLRMDLKWRVDQGKLSKTFGTVLTGMLMVVVLMPQAPFVYLMWPFPNVWTAHAGASLGLTIGLVIASDAMRLHVIPAPQATTTNSKWKKTIRLTVKWCKFAARAMCVWSWGPLF